MTTPHSPLTGRPLGAAKGRLPMRPRSIATILALAFACRAEAQSGVMTIVPSAPTSADYVDVVINGSDGDCDPPSRVSAVVFGQQVRVTIERCGVGVAVPCGWTRSVSLGRLQPGIYVVGPAAVQHLCTGGVDTLGEAITFSVAEGVIVPTLGPSTRLVLALFLALGGYLVLRR